MPGTATTLRDAMAAIPVPGSVVDKGIAFFNSVAGTIGPYGTQDQSYKPNYAYGQYAIIIQGGVLYWCNTAHTSRPTFDATEQTSWTSAGGGPTTPTLNVRTVTANTTAVANDFILVNANAANVTVTLPASPTVGQSVIVQRIDNLVGGFTCTIQAAGMTIQGDPTCTIVAQFWGATFTYTGGTTWNLSSTIGVGSSGGGTSFGAPAYTFGTTNVAGSTGTAVATDATIALFDATAPTTSAVGDAAAVGSIAKSARRDHVHGRESFATNAVVLGTAAAAGAATTPMRSNDTIAAFDATAPVTQAFGDAAAVGAIAFAARRDHKHGMPALPTPPAIVRTTSVAYAATVTPNAGTTDVLNIAALTGAITIAAPSGSPVDGQTLTIRMLQDGTGGRVVTWNVAFAFGTDITAAMEPTTANSKWERIFEWNATDSKWRATGIVRGF